MQITLPLPPSDNALRRAGRSRSGKPYSYPTDQYKKWLGVADRWLEGQPAGVLGGDVTVHLAVFFPTMAGDLTNRIKATHDKLIKVAYRDDSQIVAAAQRREVDADNPRVVATIQPVNADLFVGKERRSGSPDRRRAFTFDMEF